MVSPKNFSAPAKMKISCPHNHLNIILHTLFGVKLTNNLFTVNIL